MNRTQNDCELFDVERDVENKWRWEWLETSINVDPAELHPKLKLTGGPITVIAKDCVRKIDVAGTALCQICTSIIEYNNSGLKGLTQHLKSKKHLEKLTTMVHTQRLPGSSNANPDSMYGALSVNYEESAPPPSSSSVHKPSVHLQDRVANM